MNLDSKEEYFEAKKELEKMSDRDLESLLSNLSEELYVLGYNELKEYHRVASAVYNKRKSKGTSLIFHLKNFIPV